MSPDACALRHRVDDACRRIADLPDAGDGPSGPDLVAALRASGLLAASAPARFGGLGLAHQPPCVEDLVEALAAVGGSSLSAGRLFEGHVNAVKLAVLHGSERLLAEAGQGALLGVWGADGPDPVRIERPVLRGAKLFASGADTVDAAIVTARDGTGAIRLLALRRPALAGRLHPEEWQTGGMCATASGRADLDGLALDALEPLGGPGAYFIEPHFQGGVWRYAAVQMGAMRRLTALAADQLSRRGQQEAPLQADRLRQMATECETARLWLLSAAGEVERADAGASAAETAILARLTVARAAMEVLRLFDEAVGAASFARAHPAERIRRDLLFYLRQANPDGLALDAMARIQADPARRARWRLDP